MRRRILNVYFILTLFPITISAQNRVEENRNGKDPLELYFNRIKSDQILDTSYVVNQDSFLIKSTKSSVDVYTSFLVKYNYGGLKSLMDVTYASDTITISLDQLSIRMYDLTYDGALFYLDTHQTQSGSLRIEDCTFTGLFIIVDSKIEHDILFKGAQLNGELFLVGGESEIESLRILNTVFEMRPNMGSNLLHEYPNRAFSLIPEVDITHNPFEEHYKYPHYKELVSFEGSTFKKGLDFGGATLPERLILKDVRSNESINLTNTKRSLGSLRKDEFCKINLIGTDLSKLEFSYENFQLDIPEVIGNVFTFDIWNKEYERLLQHFKEIGQLTSYEKIDKEYREFIFTKDPRSGWGAYILNILNKYWNDYGYNKSLIWWWTAIFFIFFWGYNWLRLPHLYFKAYKPRSLHAIIDERSNTGQYHLYKGVEKKFNLRGLDISLYYTTIIFFGIKLDANNFEFNNLRGVLYVGFQYTIGLICLGYLANFVITAGVIGG
ncbi:hypothetical protein [uncultured Roseivirga sp.]|uniref:hypothetical protein n=1 Tax=uncultured Roseivirga sp. TaxID=543088 RepID=UPI000D79D5F1|nr:hypothetical protein [uncultured Roseivirga sp.]PWL30986.1 MAG: hypothetical protein DCO95_05780 [Roseivirga sp. XM-24bin3]